MTLFLTSSGKYRNILDKFMFMLREISAGEKRKYQLMCALTSASRNVDVMLTIALDAQLIYTTSLPRNRTGFNITEKGRRLVQVWYS